MSGYKRRRYRANAKFIVLISINQRTGFRLVRWFMPYFVYNVFKNNSFLMRFTMNNRHQQIKSYLKESVEAYNYNRDKSRLKQVPYSHLLSKFNERYIATSILHKYGFICTFVNTRDKNIEIHRFYNQWCDFTINIHFSKSTDPNTNKDIVWSCSIPIIEWVESVKSSFENLDTSNDAAFSIYCILIHKGNINRAFSEFVLGDDDLIKLCNDEGMKIDDSLRSDNNSLFPFPLNLQKNLNEEVRNLQNQVATLEAETDQLKRESQRNLIEAHYRPYSRPSVFNPSFDYLYPSSTFGSAEWMNHQDCIDKGFFNNSSIPIGLMKNGESFDKIYYQDERHLITIAPSGTGKNAAVQIPVLLEYEGSVLIIDPKGESAAITARHRKTIQDDVYILNPFDELSEHFDALGNLINDPTAFKSKGFNPLARLNHEKDNFVADVAFLCEALIETQGNDPYWSNSARELIACLVMYVCVTEDADSPTRNLVEVRRLLTQSEKDLLGFLSDIAGVSNVNQKKDVVHSENNAEFTTALDNDDKIPEIRDTKATDEELANVTDEYLSKIEEARNFRPIIQKANFFVGSSGSIPSIIAVARTQTNFLDDKKLAENLSRNDIDFLDMKTKKITVYIVLPIKYLIAYSRWFRLLINSALSDMMSTHEKGDKNVLFMLDECAILGELPCLQTAVGLARGYGIQLWTFWQDIHQLHDIYKTRAQSFLANTGVQQYFTPNDMLSSEVITKRMGDKTIMTRQRNINDRGDQNVSESQTGVPLVRGNEMLEMPNSDQILSG